MRVAKSWISPSKLKDDSKYKDWKEELKMWQALNELENEKQGPAVFMILKDKAKKTVLELEVKEISRGNGVKVITKI